MAGLDALVEVRQSRQRWVLVFGVLQLVVLVVGAGVGFATGAFGYLALAAAWMFLATRISRYVLGDREVGQRVGQQVRRRVLNEGLHGQVPADVAEALQAVAEHRERMLQLSGGVGAAFALGAAALAVPWLAPWLFGLALVVGIGGIGWAWSRRRTWAEARARVDAWAEAAQPLEPASPAPPPERPALRVIEGGRADEAETAADADPDAGGPANGPSDRPGGGGDEAS